jgi:hypothetical protein
MFSAFRNWWRRSTRPVSLAPGQWARVEARLPFLDFLAPEDRDRLRRLALEFLEHKEFSGAQGFEPDDDVRLSVALQACLLVLNLGLNWYAGWIGIVMYPGDFVIPRKEIDEDGVTHEYDDQVAGEAWEGGPVILSWFARPEDAEGMNVVIHEFAHKLDMRNGPVDGLPPLHEGMSRSDWATALTAAYEDICARVDRGKQTALDPYAAEHPAEFFAVASETFFETPWLLRNTYPAVYEQLRLFYRQDPAGSSP